MAKTSGIAALFILGISAVVHFATYIPVIPISMEVVWPLHAATIAICGVMAFSLAAEQRRHPPKPTQTFFGKWRAASQQSREFQFKVLGFVPGPLRAACLAAVVYAFVNFAAFIVLMEGGGPSVEHGKYYLQSHGQTIREITEQEYQRFCAYEVRGFSGHWMLFSIIPMTYFLAVYPKLREQTESGPNESSDQTHGIG